MSIDRNLQSREIIVKAVCGKGRKFSHVSHTVTPPHAPTSILGAWIINNQYEAVKSGEGVEVVGTYDINIWYSYDRNTKTDVAKETVSYAEVVGLSYLDKRHKSATAEVSAVATQEPNCVEASISGGGNVLIRVEREFHVELTAETKVHVIVDPSGGDFEEKHVDFDLISDDGDFEDLNPDLLEDDLS
ncbi:outer spore coat protein CotE [Paenibacillus chitinolyticus]|uniref:outer spore coat protein CotE n=1 Tax=Paenibacillus TaxID=44249 RepID=UPI002DBBCA27|nr:outer spore coat protein CotE [Paenibacillus chitinolyticus]MEC0249171.1 outer spore coat protein CotE [Paenibacillus chitinolyticus]